jgi:hypothetical protein
LEKSLLVMEFDAKFRLNSPNLASVVKQVEALGLSGRQKAEVLLQCANVIYLADFGDKAHLRKCMFWCLIIVCYLFI